MTRFVLYGLVGLAMACLLTVLAGTLTAQCALEREARAKVERGLLIAWHILHETGTDARLQDGHLYIGTVLLDGNLSLVDSVQQLTGDLTTVFKGDLRVATNVPDSSGARGVGTRLITPAIREAVFQRHQPYRGIVDVLGQTYLSGYDPMFDRDRQVIGALAIVVKQSDVSVEIAEAGMLVAAASCGTAVLAGLLLHWFGRRLNRLILARECSLATANGRLDMALATMANGLCLWDADNRLVLANARLCEILGLPPERVVPGMSFRDYLRLRHAAGNFGDVDFEEIYLERLGFIERRQPVTHLDTSLAGRAITILHRPIPSGGWIATYDDVTEQRAAERARANAEADLLRERERMAEEASRAKSGFLAMMSHEIRTPMNAVLGLAGSLLDGSLMPEQHRLVQAIHESGALLLRILNDILDFTKLEAGKMTLEEAPFAPGTLTHSVVSVLGPQATEKGLTIDATCAASVPEVLVGDAGRIRQILLNLASNAVKFTDTGWVRINATCMRQDATSATICWSVRDTGIGIPADRIGALFGDFVQADNSITRRFGGSGLGLAISKRLVTQMGGTIHVESALGEGTLFQVELTLPISTQSLASSARPTDATPAFLDLLAARSERLRILFAEDNATNQLVARQLLKDLDVQVDVVGDGREAVEAATRFAYDVIFMDMRMPEMDGLRASRMIRRQGGALARVPIIALTANAFAEDVKACLDAGMDQFLPKPVSKEMLVSAMYRALTHESASAPMLPPTSAAPATELACDEPALAELCESMGAPAVSEMIDVFEADTRARLAAMRASLHDRPTLLRDAHSLRGAAAAVGAPALAHLAGLAEARLKAGQSVSESDLTRLTEAFARYLSVAEPARYMDTRGA